MARDLAQRVRNTAVAQQNGDGDKPTLRQLIERMKPEIGKALPKHMDPDRIARIAITLVGGNAALAACTPESFLGALMTASQLGLEPGPLGEAYLVPFGDKVTFIAGYRGLIKLAYQSEQLKRIGAHVVRENDEFDFGYGLDPYLTHKPALGNRGDAIAVYAAAKLVNDECPFVVMSIDEVERIRERSHAAKKGPWVTDWDAMARKTAVRQLARWLPMSTDRAGFNTAVALDGTTRTDIGGTVDDQIPYVDGTIETTALPPAAPTPVQPLAVAEPISVDVPPDEPTTVEAEAAQAAAEGTQDEPEPQPADPALVNKIREQLRKIGVDNPSEQVHVLGTMTGRKLPNSAALTSAEGQAVVEHLVRVGHADEPLNALDHLLGELQESRNTNA